MNNFVSAADTDIDVDYDPVLCKTDAEEMVYFALGRTVFKAHYKEPIFIRGMPKEKRSLLPTRPDPAEPEGCPDNPIWGSAFTFAYNYQRVANKQSMKMYPDRLGLVYVEGEYTAQKGPEKAYSRVKRKYDLCREITSELVGCYSGKNPAPSKDWNDKPPEFFKNWGERTRPFKDWNARAYQAKREFYTAPFDRPYAFSCYPGVREENKCNVAYKYSEDIGVYYGFGTLSIPVTDTIDFDRGLRKRINEMHVREYAWPDI